MKKNIVIIGGAGHIGLPLGMLLASKKIKVTLYDINKEYIQKIKNGKFPFMERNGQKYLDKFKNFIFPTTDVCCIKNAEIIIVCIGTPVKKNKPDLFFFFKLFKEIKSMLNPSQLIIIRSSIYPGTCEKVSKFLGKNFNNISYCPERVVQGQSISELPKLPQIISGLSTNSILSSKKIFKLICNKIIVTSILEAELIKLFSNAWRYINFSTSNQFYMICENLNIDFIKLRKNLINGYARNKNIPSAGFSAGPCLYKDTIQLNSFLKNSFEIGQEATKINEGLPEFILKKLKKKYGTTLKKKTIGVLGYSFKANIDDIRDSLAIKLIKILKKNKIKVLYSDEFAKINKSVSKTRLILESDIIIIGSPHNSYKNIKATKNKDLIDMWGIIEK
jgi:UDP-N-acetyl-D-mannosaminuronic acid dehydrogenase